MIHVTELIFSVFGSFEVGCVSSREIMTVIAPGIPKTWNDIVELILRAVCVVSTIAKDVLPSLVTETFVLFYRH